MDEKGRSLADGGTGNKKPSRVKLFSVSGRHVALFPLLETPFNLWLCLSRSSIFLPALPADPAVRALVKTILTVTYPYILHINNIVVCVGQNEPVAPITVYCNCL